MFLYLNFQTASNLLYTHTVLSILISSLLQCSFSYGTSFVDKMQMMVKVFGNVLHVDGWTHSVKDDSYESMFLCF